MMGYKNTRDRLERRAERCRSQVAAWVAVLAAVFAFVLVIVLAYGAPPQAVVILEPVLALTLGAGITLGVRALEGPLQLANRRREATSTSASTATLLLWLGCFCAIQIAFLVVDVVGRWNREDLRCPMGATHRLSAAVTIFDGAQRTVAVAACKTEKSKPAERSSSVPDGQALTNEGPGGEGGGTT